MDNDIEETRRDENLAATVVSREHIVNFKGQVVNLTKQLKELREEVIQSSQRASTAELQQDEALAQFSLLKETRQYWDEALAHTIVL